MLLALAAGCGRAELFPRPPPEGATGEGLGGGAGGGTGGVSLALSDTGGCRDAFFYAANQAGTAMVTVDWPNRIKGTRRVSELTFPLAKGVAYPDAPQVRLLRGKSLRGLACSDLIEPGTYEKHGELLSGKVSVEIMISMDGRPFATMVLDQAVFADPDGGERALPLVQAGPVFIGWVPG